MILHAALIRKWAENGGIWPYNPAHVNPASIDLCIGDKFVDLESDCRFTLSEITITPGQAILASTFEWIRMPTNAAGVLYLKSSRAREGLDHALAGWIDPGFCGNLTLELHAHRSVTIRSGQRVVQLVLMQTTGHAQYNGRYQGQTGPTEARA